MKEEKRGMALLILMVFIVGCIIVAAMDMPTEIFDYMCGVILLGGCMFGAIKFGVYVFRKR